MERILNDDEKIRRAEEIYFRRNNQHVSYKNRDNNSSKRYVKDKIMLQLLIMVNITVIVFCVQNRNFIFTSEFLETINQYNINFSGQLINKTKQFLGINEEMENNQNNTAEENQGNVSNVENSDIVENQEIENQIVEESSSISEMELDVQNLKAAYSFINPIQGTITSRFGTRESENINVAGYHTGLDIANKEGTYIKAAMGGIVTLVSDEGDYGKHLKIRCNNVTTLYAHCSNIFVQEGQIVGQGQDIAAVGSTGNSTGPHLHFEIRIDDRFVDPGRILSL